MLKYQKQTCIICKEQSYFLKKLCNICTNTYAHKNCISKMIDENINKCPTCRENIMESSSIYITISNTSKINQKKKIIIKKIKKNIFKGVEILIFYPIICAIILFLTYYFIGIFGLILYILFGNAYRITIDPFSSIFINQFFFGIIFILIISFFVNCLCSSNDEDNS
jgi:hypothetical protein